MAKTVKPEFSFIVHPSAIAEGGKMAVFELEASRAECEALARRFGLLELESFQGTVGLRPERGGGFRLKGHIRARVVQSCVVTLEPVASEIDRPFELLLLEEGAYEGETIELEDDYDFYSGDAIDIGEIAAEELALSLDPYPRSAEAGAALDPGGADESDEAAGEKARRPGPFEALAALKRNK